MTEVEVTEEDTVDRRNWRKKIPDGKSRKKKKKGSFTIVNIYLLVQRVLI